MAKREQQRKLVEEFNASTELGTDVKVVKGDQVITTKTCSKAWLLGGHTALVKLAGLHGATLLEKVSK